MVTTYFLAVALMAGQYSQADVEAVGHVDDVVVVVERGGDQDRALAPVLLESAFDSGEAWWGEEGDLRGVAARRR